MAKQEALDTPSLHPQRVRQPSNRGPVAVIFLARATDPRLGYVTRTRNNRVNKQLFRSYTE